KNSDQPENRSELSQMFRVTVDPVWSNKYLQISQQMSDHKHDQNDAGRSDDYFFPDRRTIKMCQNLHATNILQDGSRITPRRSLGDTGGGATHCRNKPACCQFRLWTPVVASSYSDRPTPGSKAYLLWNSSQRGCD